MDVSHPEKKGSFPGFCVCVWVDVGVGGALGDCEMQVFVGGELSLVVLFRKGKAKTPESEGENPGKKWAHNCEFRCMGESS